ncbi:hypothetical protein [Streptomyces rubellomurinus]|uniref:Uncharacterized protein n=1 Tax=Streptomyces rubellomurinus (strain ATCC 31215) TaxID=359131 RepID=A0A0F2T9R5_STRR3|nr:hypothetical protein [Streptomyces rubellomurinus]KJS59954.1 hypothetical protein VM95_24285 [Streptomyces rubellomurinus]
MERVIDLDQAVLEVERRRSRWEEAGLTVEPVTWRDEEQEWPQQLELDRTAVVDPDSLGVVITGLGGELSVVLFRGGWTDVDYFAGLDDAGTLPTSAIDSAAAFGEQLDNHVTRVFGSFSETA